MHEKTYHTSYTQLNACYIQSYVRWLQFEALHTDEDTWVSFSPQTKLLVQRVQFKQWTLCIILSLWAQLCFYSFTTLQIINWYWVINQIRQAWLYKEKLKINADNVFKHWSSILSSSILYSTVVCANHFASSRNFFTIPSWKLVIFLKIKFSQYF